MQVVASVLALLAAIVAVGCAVLLVTRPAALRTPEWRGTIGIAAPWMAWLIALCATLGSLYFSEIAHFLPCKLCWYQRIAMYPLVVVLGVAGLRRDKAIAWYAVPIAGVGAVISLYHYLVEWNPSLETACDPFNPCSLIWFRRFGFVTLPFMALCGFAAIIGLTLLAARAGRDDATHGRPGSRPSQQQR